MANIRVHVGLSDPFELGEAMGWRPIFGEIIKMDISNKRGRALVRFDEPLNWRGVNYSFAVATPRLSGDEIMDFKKPAGVGCGFTCVTEEHAMSENSLSTDHWRGGLGLTARLIALNSEDESNAGDLESGPDSK